MSKVFIEESTLTAIGDAIREKNGTTDMIAPLDMATMITNLPSGGGGNLSIKTGKWYNAGTTYLTKFSLDFSEELGTEDNKPFYFYMQGYYNSTSYVSCLILYCDSENNVSLLNKFPNTTSTNYLVGRYKSASRSDGILTVNFKDKIYQTNNNNDGVYFLFYTE